MSRRLPAALALLLATAACSDDADPVSPPEGAAALLPCVFGAGLQLEVGEVSTAEGEVLCLEGGGEFLLVPFFASRNGEARLRVDVTGGNVVAVTEPAAARAPADAPRVWEERPLPELEWHHRFLERTRRELEPRIGTAPRTARAPLGPSPLAEVPVEGQVLDLNVSTRCDVKDVRRGRVAAVTQRAVVVTDVANPAGGPTDEQYRAFGRDFDDLVYPVDTRNFGDPTDIDGNGRVTIFFTRAVNEIPVAGGIIGGFFWAGDLFPTRDTGRLGGCDASNFSEIFYIRAADPQGMAGRATSLDYVLRGSVGTIAHELEHLINAGRRLYVNGADDFEDVWLDEGLAHVAEELLFYETTPLEPRQNITLETLRSSDALLDATNRYLLENFARYALYLAEPDSSSLLGPDGLETRGAAWAFLRYAADREPGPDRELFFRLVNSTRSGTANLNQALGAVTRSEVDAIRWMQDWTVSVYADDVVAVEPKYTQPSWHFRSIEPAVAALLRRPREFPLSVRRLSREAPLQLRLRGGGASFVRFGVAPSGRAAIRLAPGGAGTDKLRYSLVRTR